MRVCARGGSWNSAGSSIANPAYPNPARLSETLGAISLDGMAAVGSMQGPLSEEWAVGYKGRMAWVQIFKTAISEHDSFCLFSVPDLVVGCSGERPDNLLGESISALVLLVPAYLQHTLL